MLTHKRVEMMIKKRHAYPTIEAFRLYAQKAKRLLDDDQKEKYAQKKFKEAMADLKRNVDRLVRVSNAYDFVFDNFILGKPADEAKSHFQVCEDILNTESIRLRKELKIDVVDVGD
mgnify:CR=1 FL=1